MRVVGIDFSSHAIDLVSLDYDSYYPTEWRRYELRGRDAFERTRYVSSAIPHRHSSYWDTVAAVGIEHPAGHHGTQALLRIQGAVLACIPLSILVEPWPPAKWRKATHLAGNATKADVAQASINNLGEPDWPQDAHDAHLIALATRLAITIEQPA